MAMMDELGDMIRKQQQLRDKTFEQGQDMRRGQRGQRGQQGQQPGDQQMSELQPVSGIDIVGPLPKDIQRVTIFSAGIVADSAVSMAARALVDFLASPAAFAAIRSSGLEPAAVPAGKR